MQMTTNVSDANTISPQSTSVQWKMNKEISEAAESKQKDLDFAC